MSGESGDTGLSLIPKFSVGGNIDKDDVIAISIAAYEGKLGQDESMLKEEKKKAAKELSAVVEALAKELKVVEAKYSKDPKYKAVIDALTKAGFGKYTIHVHAGETTKDNKSVLAVGVQVSEDTARDHDRYGNHKISLGEMIPFTPTYKALKKQNKEIMSNIGDLEEQILQIKKDMANIAKKEREARANLAVIQLEKSSEGRALLKRIGVTPTLPAPKKKAKKTKKKARK